MRTTESITFYCRKSKVSKKTGQAPIEMSIIIGGNRKFINLPYKCKPQVFNKKKPQDVEEYLSLMRTKVNEAITELMRNNTPVTSDTIREYIQTGGIKSYTVNDLTTDYLNILQKRVEAKDLTPQVYNKYQKVTEILKSYIEGNKEVTTITPALIQRIYADMKAKYKAQTSGGYMTKLKTIIKYAIDNGYLKINPFQGTKISKGKSEIHFLTEEEIAIIEHNHFGIERIEKVRDLFVFQLSTGLAYTDMANLTPGDLKSENGTYYIRKERLKTKEIFTAVVLPAGVEVWNKYNGNLPVLSNQKYNGYLKEIQALLGISTNLTTHLARKSYCCRLLAHKVPLLTVSKCLGHSSTKVTQTYYAALTKSEILEEVSSAFHVG